MLKLTGILAFFTRMELAIVLLTAIALASLVGVLLPQEHLVDVFEIRGRFGQAYPWMNALGLFNVFGSLWFIVLEVLFFFSVLFGSFLWLKPAWADAFEVQFLQSHELRTRFPNAVNPLTLGANPVSTLAQWLQTKGYKVSHTNEQLYATKGQLSRIGPMLAHVGIVTILLASLYGAFTNFLAQKVAVSGEQFAISEAETFKTTVPLKQWQGHLPKWQVRVSDFSIDYYAERPSMAKQYTSQLEIVSADGQKVLASGQSSVNHPFSYDGVTIYQASFAPTGRFFITLDGKQLTVEASHTLEGRAYGAVALDTSTQLLLFPFFPQQDGVPETHLQVFTSHEGELAKGRLGQLKATYLADGTTVSVDGHTLLLRRPEIATGLQIRATPEYPWMLLGFSILASGVLLSLQPQKQIWLSSDSRNKKDRWLLASRSRKDKPGLKRDVAALLNQVASSL